MQRDLLTKSVPLPSTCALYSGDCLDVMPTLFAGGAQMAFLDMPYGSTQCAWDQRLDLTAVWQALTPLMAARSCVVATADIRFALKMIASARMEFRYDLIWHKSRSSGFLNANRAPLRAHEIILYFSTPGGVFNVIKKNTWRDRKPSKFSRVKETECYGVAEKPGTYVYGPQRNPTSVIEPESPAAERGLHPTQKPTALLEWLIASYTNPGDTVIDPCMGSGTAGVACARLGRDFIGIEKDPAYFQAASKRIGDERARLGL